MSSEESPTAVPHPDAVIPERAPGGPQPGDRVPSHYPHCVGCGEEAPGGLRVHVVAGVGLTVRGTLAITDAHQGAPGLAHGGLVATAIDEVMGALSYLLMRPAVTGRLEVDYRRPVPVGSTIVIDAEIIGQKGRKVYTRSVVRFEGEANGPVVAEGAGVFVQVSLEHFTSHGSPEHVMAVIDHPEHGLAHWTVNP